MCWHVDVAMYVFLRTFEKKKFGYDQITFHLI